MVVRNRRVIDTRKIARRLSVRSGLTVEQVLELLRELGVVMSDYLSDGNLVVLDGIGAFRVSVQARGTSVTDEDLVSADQFNYIKVLFTPEARTSRLHGTKEISLLSKGLQFASVEDTGSADDIGQPNDSDSGKN